MDPQHCFGHIRCTWLERTFLSLARHECAHTLPRVGVPQLGRPVLWAAHQQVVVLHIEWTVFISNALCPPSQKVWQQGNKVDINPWNEGGLKKSRQKFKKFTAEKKFNLFLIKNYYLPIPRPPFRTSKLQKKPSALKREHQALHS